MVSVGFLEAAVFNQLLRELPGFAVTVLLALGLGVAGSMLLASRLKRQTFGLEPYEIAGLLEEQEPSPLIGMERSRSRTTRRAACWRCPQTVSVAACRRSSRRAGC
jgi:hypothetical protein